MATRLHWSGETVMMRAPNPTVKSYRPLRSVKNNGGRSLIGGKSRPGSNARLPTIQNNPSPDIDRKYRIRSALFFSLLLSILMSNSRAQSQHAVFSTERPSLQLDLHIMGTNLTREEHVTLGPSLS